MAGITRHCILKQCDNCGLLALKPLGVMFQDLAVSTKLMSSLIYILSKAKKSHSSVSLGMVSN